ncbi:NHP2-like protein 1 [Glugoides intestinalis]
MENELLSSKKTQELYKLIYSLKPEGKIKIGFNETVKAVNNNTALLAVVAKDACPACLVEPLPILCERKGVQCVFVESKTALGKACGAEVDVLACAVFVPKHENDTSNISNKISQVFFK